MSKKKKNHTHKKEKKTIDAREQCRRQIRNQQIRFCQVERHLSYRVQCHRLACQLSDLTNWVYPRGWLRCTWLVYIYQTGYHDGYIRLRIFVHQRWCAALSHSTTRATTTIIMLLLLVMIMMIFRKFQII